MRRKWQAVLLDDWTDQSYIHTDHPEIDLLLTTTHPVSEEELKRLRAEIHKMAERIVRKMGDE